MYFPFKMLPLKIKQLSVCKHASFKQLNHFSIFSFIFDIPPMLTSFGGATTFSINDTQNNGTQHYH